MLFLLVLLVSAPLWGATPCEGLTSLQLPNTRIAEAHTVTGGAFTPPGQREIKDLSELCRVVGSIHPTSDSDIRFEVWLPTKTWNGKFHGVGNGGFAGSISHGGIAGAVRAGFAAASTDTGHGAGQGIDATWAKGHPEKLIDYGHRAVHEMTVKAKAIVQAYYGKPAQRSYFWSCSNGGRQALMEAQRYPEDYDGIVAGAPAHDFVRLLIGFAWNAQALAAPGAYIPPAKLPAIEAAVLAACDMKDGVEDGILGNPPECSFQPRTLLCQGSETDACLTSPQVEALEKIYAGPKDAKGRQVIPGFPPGAETGPGGWQGWITGTKPGTSAQYGFASQLLANMVPNPTTIADFRLDRDGKPIEKAVAKTLSATNPDLSAFYKRGGKLILYHGWNDAAIPAGSSIDYFNAVKAKMSAAKTDSFVRLYLLPGVQHCGGGPGLGLTGGTVDDRADPSRNVGTALARWVEQGVAPGVLTGSRPENRTRPVCPYPRVARYQGTGNPDEAASYRCQAP